MVMLLDFLEELISIARLFLVCTCHYVPFMCSSCCAHMYICYFTVSLL
jgi:hypothetical protein